MASNVNKNIGQLKWRVEIWRKQPETGTNYITTTSIAKLTTCWAAVESYPKGDKWIPADGEYQTRRTINVTIRYPACPDVAEDDYVKFKDEVYNVRYVDKGEYDKRFIRMQCELVEQNNVIPDPPTPPTPPTPDPEPDDPLETDTEEVDGDDA